MKLSESLPEYFKNRLSSDHWDIIWELEQTFTEEDYSQRYEPKFIWFEENLIETEKVLNPGCGRGRETFALMELLDAAEAVGVDISSDKISEANQLNHLVRKFSSKLLLSLEESIQSHTAWWGAPDKAKFERERQDLTQQLETWKQTLPAWLVQGETPQFKQGDISQRADLRNWPDDYFDVIYCRYVLHQIGEQKLLAVAKNIARLIKPETGRVIVIEPSRKDGEERDFVRPFFSKAGLTLLDHETNTEKLQFDSLLPARHEYIYYPEGHIYKKSS